jgi:NADH:ubiquinone oxidoreductase subunit 5 (subunit L)/multisubunit Na+/H+ antiporter MnhA subunit
MTFLSVALLLLIGFPRIVNDFGCLNKISFGRVWAYLGSVGFAILTGIAVAMNEPIKYLFFTVSESLTFGVSLDPFSGLISTSVMFIGATIMRFSERFLADDPQKSQFCSFDAELYELANVLARLGGNIILFT